MCIIWITSTQTLETIGDEWIANLKGEHGRLKKYLPYTETDGYAIKNRQDNGTSYYLYRKEIRTVSR